MTRLTLITLALILITLTACTGDPLGIVAREQVRSAAAIQTAQIQADAATDQARIDASTSRLRYGGWMVGAAIAGVVVVVVAGIAGATHIQAQRDRLSYRPETWSASLPTTTPAQALPRSRQSQPMPLLAMTQRRRAPSPTLALPERSASAHDVVVIDA